MAPADRVWHHVVITTYGSWLPGDARGFRTRHHREHVEGDYNNPPPAGKYADRERRCRGLLKQPPVAIPPEWRARVGRALWQEFTRLGAWLLAAGVAARHAHPLVKLQHGRSRHLVGRAKRHSTMEMHQRGWAGKLWSVGSKSVPIRDRAHQLNTYQYILRHAEDGAWVGIWKEEDVDGKQQP